MGLSLAMLAALGWLLARLVWLPFYFGLFFFLVAGLLVGAVGFRIARPARPLPRGRIFTGVCATALAGMALTVLWEYEHVAGTIGTDRKFPDAKSAALTHGGSAAEVERQATVTFKAALRGDYPPGGPIGYVRWAIGAGEMHLTINGCIDLVSIGHCGLTWLLRTAAALVLLTIGLSLSFDSLRLASPLSNVLAPGEEGEEVGK